MKTTTSKIFLTFSSLLLLTNAWPVLNKHQGRRIEERAPVSYSVVAVDGGSTTQSIPTATVTNAITQTQTLVTTKLSTTIITESETPTTVVLTITATSATTIVQSAPTATVTAMESSDPPASSSLDHTSSSSSIPTVTISEAPIVTTAAATASVLTVYVSPEVTSSAYDDGMWHTTYYQKATISNTLSDYTPSSTTAPASSESTALSTSEVDDDLEASSLNESFSSWSGSPSSQ